MYITRMKSHRTNKFLFVLIFILIIVGSAFHDIKTNAQTVVSNEGIEFEQYLTQQGFPESYKLYLRNLHEKHPNWIFKSLKTNIDWDTAINSETFIVYRNMVPANSLDSWKSVEDGAYDWTTGQWKEYEDGWVAASREILKYYMDPRNFLNDNASIFQFYTLSYTGEETEKGLENILRGTFMGKSEALLEEYIGYFMEAAKKSGVSPYFLASRVVQEVSKPGGAHSGSVAGPFYNYYNIGATGDDPIAAAVAYAKAQGWTSQRISIVEGAKWIANGYINQGQDTLYLQKFDVVDGGNGYFWHQYMANIIAPTSEATKLAKAHPGYGEANIIFTIPIYKNMPDTPSAKPLSTGNPNNLLRSLVVEGYSLTPSYDMYTTEYDLIVPANVSEININASSVLDKASISGAGKINIQPGSNQIDIAVTAENGNRKTYTVYVEREQSLDKDINITSSIYTIDVNITGVEPGTRVETLKNYLQVTDGDIIVVDKNGNPSFGTVGTGTKVQVKQDGKIIKTYPIVVYGDTNGDGKISIIDLALIQQHILRVNSLSGIYLEAADTNRGKDGISILDLAFVQRHILNVDLIKQ